jgi:hypothetical protein
LLLVVVGAVVDLVEQIWPVAALAAEVAVAQKASSM